MRIVGESRIALGVFAAIAVIAACARKPLPARDDGGALDPPDPPDVGSGGQTGTGCAGAAPHLELVGTPLLMLDSPPVNGNLYTSLVWTGEEYLFVWRIFGGDAVLMQRIDASGQAVGGNIRLRPYENAFDLAWAGSRLAAVWTSGPSTGAQRDLMFQTFDGLGRPLIDPVTLRSSAGIAVDGSVSYGPRMVPITGGFAIAWSEGGIIVATVDLDGNLLHQPVAASDGDPGSSPMPGLAAADDRILVSWTARGVSTSPVPLLASALAARAFAGNLTPLGGTMDLDDAVYSGSHQVLATPSGFVALWAHGTPAPEVARESIPVRIGHLPAAGTSAAIATIAPPVAGPYRHLAPAVWNRDHLVVLWDRSTTNENGVTLSRFAPTGVRQGESIELPTAAPATRLYLAAHDGIVGFIWSEEADRGYQVYFQQARSCP